MFQAQCVQKCSPGGDKFTACVCIQRVASVVQANQGNVDLNGTIRNGRGEVRVMSLNVPWRVSWPTTRLSILPRASVKGLCNDLQATVLTCAMHASCNHLPVHFEELRCHLYRWLCVSSQVRTHSQARSGKNMLGPLKPRVSRQMRPQSHVPSSRRRKTRASKQRARARDSAIAE